MKKITLAITLTLFVSFAAFSQMNDGNYKFANNEITFSFRISENGWKITDIVILNNTTKAVKKGEGEWMQPNTRGMDPNYDGPMGWYQFSINNCDFEFDLPKSKLILSQSCSGGKSKKYQLIKKN